MPISESSSTAPLTVAISGATGLVGTALRRLLQEEHVRVRPMVRQSPKSSDEIHWDPARGTVDVESLVGVDAVVHLAGANIGDKRWSPAHKAAIRDSRVDGTRLLARALAGLEGGPRVLLSGSAVGFYGSSEAATFRETDPPGDGFLAEVCRAWEDAASPALEAGLRVVFLRTGVVLSADGGALERQLSLYRAGLGGPVGSGRQWISWISLEDEVRAISHLLRGRIAGPVNLVAPNPVTQREFARTLGKALGRPALLPAPAIALQALLGKERARSLLLEGQRVQPEVLQGDGFRFQHPALEQALDAILS